MSKTKTFQATVYPWHCDHMGHMNVQFYVAFFDQATWNLFAEIGLHSDYLRIEKKGLVALEQHISYKGELLSGDTFYIDSEFTELNDKTVRFRHTMKKLSDGKVSAITNLLGLHMDLKLRKGDSIPDFFRKSIQAKIEPQLNR